MGSSLLFHPVDPGAKFAFDIYDFEGKARMDLFYLGDCLRGMNQNPTLKTIESLGGTKKKGEKYITLEEFNKIYAQIKKAKDKGSFEDFLECLKLYDKHENGTMMLGELEHILLSLGNYTENLIMIGRTVIYLTAMANGQP